MKHAYIDEYSNTKSFIHRLDPRIKIITTVLLTLFIVFTKPNQFIALGLYAVVILGLILLSKIPVGFIFKRSLVIIPFVLMAVMFIPFLKKGEVAGSYSLGILKLTVTYHGLMIFWNILSKAYLSTLNMIVLISSTKFSSLLKSFEKLKFPPVLIMVLSFMYRYLFVIIDELGQMKMAKQARSVGPIRCCQGKVLANMIGVLFIRSYERAEAVYFSMRSRGFNGNIVTIDNFQLKVKDYYFLAALISILTGIKIWAN